MYLLVLVHILQSSLLAVHSCPSLCACSYGNSGTAELRSVQCSDPGISVVPINVPANTVKLRLEKTLISRVPRAAFYNLSELRFLWLVYNSITSIHPSSFVNLKALRELRLDGNFLTSFPWEGLRDMPQLQTLGLHNNRLSSLPAHAALFLPNITYLDLSSNRWVHMLYNHVLRIQTQIQMKAGKCTEKERLPKLTGSQRHRAKLRKQERKHDETSGGKLTILPAELLDLWFPLPGQQGGPTQRRILGLHDNPWLCDCQISMVMSLSMSLWSPVVLMDQLLMCSRSLGQSGVLLTQAQLSRCMRPSVQPAATRVVSPLGSNVILRCDATGYPTPTLTWIKTSAYKIYNTVMQESPRVGVRWSIISLNGLSYKDAGEYRCQARNMGGISEALIRLRVVGVTRVSRPPKKKSQKTPPKPSLKYRRPNQNPATINTPSMKENQISLNITPPSLNKTQTAPDPGSRVFPADEYKVDSPDTKKKTQTSIKSTPESSDNSTSALLSETQRYKEEQDR
ncbi:leucine-rich repeat, immunoglobulin-like domain and transmembrane domain-containing protein 3b [Seriola aureovittata]|uniref:leucine-rich repeat, immunoglobulin-like domain and transmembrane domain-containing protein 3b n=1 Tax=Seriola aureovittata TaxID=2871759 RepID=UPI0024BE504C|nr:leucine-rich repeat, immunoglobulin-like domain and transmembrane domain-containing protein 3b [Seriola aureovittata]